MFTFLETLGGLAHFSFRTLLALPAALVRPRELSAQLHDQLIGALPLAFTAGAAIGVVVWLHLRGALTAVAGPGAVRYLPDALSLAVVLEFAPMAAGLIVAGRAGAKLGAGLGAMTLTEQIDALEVQGLNPLRELAGPRVLACMAALPLLTVFIAALALLCGGLAEAVGGSMTPTQFADECRKILTLGDVVPSTLKTVVFGWLIGSAGCYFGMTARGGAEGVGRAATAGVVASLFLVLISDVVLVKLIQVVRFYLAAR
jgi:phospholipid/cholesterol/gamma-HCH transport system permease protein